MIIFHYFFGGISILTDDLKFKDKIIPRIVLGTATFTGEQYFGHRSRIYEMDFEDHPENIAKLIEKAYSMGVKSINLVNNDNLLKAYELACENGVRMDVIATIGKSNVNYLHPDFEKAKKVNWMEDIEKLGKYNPSVMLIDEFLVNSFDWDYLKEILDEINKSNSFSGLITFTPFETTEKLLESSIKDDFDFYMIPVNKFAYIMDCDSFLKEDQERLAALLEKLNKKIIIHKALAVGILQPKDAFSFLNTLDFVDMVAVGVAKEKEVDETFNTLFDI